MNKNPATVKAKNQRQNLQQPQRRKIEERKKGTVKPE